MKLTATTVTAFPLVAVFVSAPVSAHDHHYDHGASHSSHNRGLEELGGQRSPFCGTSDLSQEEMNKAENEMRIWEEAHGPSYRADSQHSYLYFL